MSLINLVNINKFYHNGEKEFYALKDINLSINNNSLTAIMGASGSGKSTLMNILGCLDRPSSGNYYFDNENIINANNKILTAIRNKKIGFIFQSFYLLPRLTILDNVILPLYYRNMTSYMAKQQGLAILDKLGLAHLAGQRPQQLSGGQQQRIAIARALVQDPLLILADEPTGALDSTTGHEIMTIFKKLHRQFGKTIVIITHDNVIAKHCSRLIRLKDGVIIKDS